MKLDVSSLRIALTALEKSLKFLSSDMAKDPDLHEQFRAAAIQAMPSLNRICRSRLISWIGRKQRRTSEGSSRRHMLSCRAGRQHEKTLLVSES